MLQAEGIGKNLEQAIENALFELKAPREDVDIKILSEGGLFKKAKVLVSISDDAKDKYVKREVKREEENIEVIVDVEKQIGQSDEDFDKVVKNTSKIEKAIKKEIAEKSVEEQMQKIYTPKEPREDISMDPMDFLTGLLKVVGKEGYSVEMKEDDKYVTYSINGDELGDLIGHRGECFYAINRILTAVAGKTEKRILLDVGGYREKREETLTALAKRTADRVAKSGRYSRLDPMNPSDRRIIHTALQSDDRVTTLSKGTEPHRYVIVFPKEQD